MFKNEYNLTVDLKKSMTAVTPKFVQYDNATLVFKILDNGKAFDLTGFTKAEVAHKRSDGITVVGTANIEHSTNGRSVIRYEYLGSEMHKEGFTEVSLSIFSDDKKVSIYPFKVEIITDLRDKLVEDSKEEVGLLQELIAEISDILVDAHAAIDSANNAVEIATQATSDATTAIANANLAITNAQNAANETLQVKEDTLIAKSEAEQAAINANSAVVDLVHKGEYNPSTSYVVKNIVSLDGSSYMNISPSTGISPTNTLNWKKIGEKGDPGERGLPGTQGVPGETGDRGRGFSITKTYSSVAQMYADYSNPLVPVGDFVLINTPDVNNPENAMLFVKTDIEYSYLTDLSGAQGIKGEAGKDGVSFIWRNAYTNTITYLKDNVVSHNGSSFIALKTNQGITPTNDGVNWSMVAQRGVDGTGSVSGVDGFNPDSNGNVITHTNKNVLDALTDDTGKLKYNSTELETVTESNNKLDTKVDKLAGKGLSTEDFTTTEKTKLAGIETGAQVNTITSVNGATGDITGLATDTSVDNKLATKIDKTAINQPNGVAGLDQYGYLGTDKVIDTVSQQPLSQSVADLSNHLLNQQIHVTQAKKTEWDAKATTTYVDNKIGVLNGDVEAIETTITEHTSSSKTDAHAISNIVGLQSALDSKSTFSGDYNDLTNKPVNEDLTALNTTDKTSLVGAINEVNAKTSGGGDGGENWQLINEKTMAVLGDAWYSTQVDFTLYKKLKFIYKSVSGHYQTPPITATQLQLQFVGASNTFVTFGHRYLRMTGAVASAVNNTLRDLIPLLSANMAASTTYPHHELNGYLTIEKINYKDNNDSGFLPYSMEVFTDFNVRNPNGATQNIMFEKQDLVLPLALNQNFPSAIIMSNSRSSGFTKGTIEVWGVLND